MTNDQIIKIAESYCQYADTRAPTLRGNAAIIAFATELLEADRVYIRDAIRTAQDLVSSAGDVLAKVG